MSEDHISIDILRVHRIERIERETPTISTIFFSDSRCANADPGQYAMIWIPGAGEVPMSLSVIGPAERTAITVRSRGETTEALLALDLGEQIGVRGPYGKGYTLSKGKALLIGGGTGVASLSPLAEKLMELNSEVAFVLGAEREEEVLFANRLSRLEGDRFRLVVTTEDGSVGIKGRATESARRLMEKERFDKVYTCGPELMMREIFNITEEKGLELEASLERIIKCGIGLCGQCSIGPYMICKDGPVFTSDQLRELTDEFGIFTRDSTGKIVPL